MKKGYTITKDEQNAGICPRCDAENLDYGPGEPEGDYFYYPVQCLDCGFEGREYYRMTFDCFYDNEGRRV